MSAILAKKLCNLIALKCDVVQRVVGRVDQQDDLDRRLGGALAGLPIYCTKETYRLRFLVIEHDEIALLETSDRPPRSIRHQDIQLDLAFPSARRWRRAMSERGMLLIWSILARRVTFSRRTLLCNGNGGKAATARTKPSATDPSNTRDSPRSARRKVAPNDSGIIAEPPSSEQLKCQRPLAAQCCTFKAGRVNRNVGSA